MSFKDLKKYTFQPKQKELPNIPMLGMYLTLPEDFASVESGTAKAPKKHIGIEKRDKKPDSIPGK